MIKVLEHLKDLISGFIIGFVCIATPGVSGGTIAVIIGAFTKIIDNGSQLFKRMFSKKWWGIVLYFLIFLIGVLLGVLLGSQVVTITYDKYPLATTMCLIGLIFGTLPMLFKNIKPHVKNKTNILIFVITFVLALCYTFFLTGSDSVSFEKMSFTKYLVLFILGIVSVATMIIPGISGNMVVLASGYYYPLINTLSSIRSLSDAISSLNILLPYVVGGVVGAILVVMIIKSLLSKYEVPTNFAIFAFVVASPIIMIKVCLLNNAEFIYSNEEMIIGICLLLMGAIISHQITKFKK